MITNDFSAHWRDRGEEWHPFEYPPAFLYQSTDAVIALFQTSPLAVLINLDGGYICNRVVFKEVKQRHSKVITFASLPASDQPFYRTLELKHAVTTVRA